MDDAIDAALREGNGVLSVGQHPTLTWRIRRARERGELQTVLRGHYAAAEVASSFAIRVQVLLAADPDAILLGPSAAVALGWREPDPDEVVHASSQRIQGSRAGFQLTRRRIDPDLVLERGDALASPSGQGSIGIRCTNEAVTSLDLARESGPDSIDTALRGGQKLATLESTLEQQKGRVGNRDLRRYLADSRDEPWSAAERAGHIALHRRDDIDWAANVEVERSPGQRAFLDIGLASLCLAFEIDGYEHHGTRDSFSADRLRDLDLRRLGWEVVRLPADWVMEDPGRFAALVSELAELRAATLGLSPSG
ncbi:MAG: hypothetical protein Q4F65_11585 [Propionibacteriaceae bacterium]|nr:hypothetical protein [Propionibacteriaceae bacterium]